MPVVETVNLTKKYDSLTAVDNLNLAIEEGELFGFLGPNGAGKTTTILMLLGLTEPTSGIAKIGGFNSTREPLKVKSIAGYVPEQIGFYEDLSATVNLLYTARLNRLPEDIVKKRVGEALGVVGLADVANKEVATFSRGMKQRLAIADVLVKEPKVAFLDEPTSGIDPEGVNLMLDLIRNIASERKMAIILCSHQLNQVQRICNSVGIISGGKMVVEGSLDKLEKEMASESKFIVEIQLSEIVTPVVEAIEKIKGVAKIDRIEELLLVHCSEDLRPQIASTIVNNNGLLVSMKIQSYALEDVYMKYFHEG